MEAPSSKAGVPAGGKASDVSAVIEATERTGVRSGRGVKARTSAEGVAVVKAAVAEMALVKITLMEVPRWNPS